MYRGRVGANVADRAHASIARSPGRVCLGYILHAHKRVSTASVRVYVYIYIYMCVCACVCFCVRILICAFSSPKRLHVSGGKDALKEQELDTKLNLLKLERDRESQRKRERYKKRTRGKTS